MFSFGQQVNVLPGKTFHDPHYEHKAARDHKYTQNLWISWGGAWKCQGCACLVLRPGKQTAIVRSPRWKAGLLQCQHF